MQTETRMKAFIADWFGRFDRLDPVEAFLPDLHPDVDWDMEDADRSLHGHARFKAWYAQILKTLQAPTEHEISDIRLSGNTVTFRVAVRARLMDGTPISLTAAERWTFALREDGAPLITAYAAKILD